MAEYIGLKRSDEVAMTLARRWSQAMAVLVAVGAGTGTVRIPHRLGQVPIRYQFEQIWPNLLDLIWLQKAKYASPHPGPACS
jgi:cytochrome bd-type quinol oxidase subunit 1